MCLQWRFVLFIVSFRPFWWKPKILWLKGLTELFSHEKVIGLFYCFVFNVVSSIGVSLLNCFHMFLELLLDCLIILLYCEWTDLFILVIALRQKQHWKFDPSMWLWKTSEEIFGKRHNRMEFRVITTKRNGKSLLLDGYKFRFHQTVLDKKHWRCVVIRCKSRCHTDMDMTRIVKIPGEHSHAESCTRWSNEWRFVSCCCNET